MNGKALWWGVLAIGVALIVAPLAMGLPGKSAAGERMINDFQPIMAPDQVQKTADYYYNVFVPLGQITPMYTDANATKFQNYLTGMQASGLQIPPAVAKDFTQLVGSMKQAVPIASQVPAGLAHYKPLVTAMQGNVNDFDKLSSLPKFTLFTWFFAVPGALLVLLSGFGLYATDAVHLRHHKAHPAV
ncbi:MAG: hypothetical protein ACXVRZ_16840 [Gaiellaceae bacterium]